jgi:hypothetical protein
LKLYLDAQPEANKRLKLCGWYRDSRNNNGIAVCAILALFLLILAQSCESDMVRERKTYGELVQECIDLLIEHGTDTYGHIHAPVLVSIIDVDSLICPSNPQPLDEYFRVTRRGRRNPAGANLLFDQPLLKTMHFLTHVTGSDAYTTFAHRYEKYYLTNLIDEKGFPWWGWHRHYDVYRDVIEGHHGNHHEIHAIHAIDWAGLWEVEPDTVRGIIDAIWQWHVVDKQTGEIDRHDSGKEPVCDFSMSAASYIEAFAFMFTKTRDQIWLDRAKFLADYYWYRRNPDTGLFPERPNAGAERFDGSSFVTSITGLHCYSLFRAYELTGEESFRDYAVTYLKAYAKYGYDEKTGKFWGALQLDGKPIPGPRLQTVHIDSAGGYGASQPRGHLDLWEPYVAGYQYPIYTAQAYAYAFELTNEIEFMRAAERFAAWIDKTPPGMIETGNTWYSDYSEGVGRQGTYADKYGRTISFFLHLYVLTGEGGYLDNARAMADSAIDKLYYKGLFRGHPAKPYYEAIDGVGYLLYALLQLDQVVSEPASVIENRKIVVGAQKLEMPLTNW